MIYDSLDTLRDDYYNLADEDKYKEALTLLEEGLKALKEGELEKDFFNVMIDKCWFYCECKMYEEAINLFSQLVEKGYICPMDWPYKGLIENAKYEKLKERNDILFHEAEKNSKLEYEVYLPKGYSKDKKYPLFLNLHGDGDNMEYHRKYWNEEFFLKKGFIVVYLQSSQISCHRGFKWVSKEFYKESIENRKNPTLYYGAHDEVKALYNFITKEYLIDENQVIIGGFSGGAIASIDIALSNIIPLKGVIALCSRKPKKFNRENLMELSKKATKLVFMEGEEDTPVKDVEDMMRICSEIQSPYEYYINTGVGHWYPDDLEQKLDDALNFILK